MATPILNVDDIFVSEGPNATATFVLRLSQPAGAAASFSYFTSGGSASAFSDYNGVTGTVSFAVGESVKTITVPILEDLAVEPAESFVLKMSSPQNLILGRTSAIATIVDNDKIGGAPLVSVNDTRVNESDGSAAFDISLDRAATTAIVVTYQTASGSAVSGSDFVGLGGSVTFAPGEVVRTVSVQLVDDGLAEGDERFVLALTAVTVGANLASAQGTAIIEHNDGPTAALPVLTVADVAVSEGPNAFARFVLSLSQPSASTTSVTYSLSSASASFADYVDRFETITFTAGETVKVVDVAIVDDTTSEQDETFFLRVDSASGLTVTRSLAAATILDNEATGAAPLVSVADAVLNESDGEARFAITLDRASSTAITVTYKTTDGSALSGSDFEGIASSVVFLPGERTRTVAVQLIDDALAEGDETFGLQLSTVSGGGVLANAQGTATITRNDGTTTASPMLSVDDIVVNEGAGSMATFVLRLSQPSSATASVSYSLASGTAFNSSDYWFVSDTIRFAPGETVRTITVPILQDSSVERPEFFFLSFSAPQGLTLQRSTAIAIIVDDDSIAAAPSVSVGDVAANESDGDAYFTITLDRASSAAITVSYQTVDGTASAGADYASAASSVVFQPGETARTIAVRLIDDTAAEAQETFSLRLTGATGGAILASAVGTATIGHSDGPVAAVPLLTVDDLVVGEGAFARFVLRLSQPSAAVTAVSYALGFSTAVSSSDYWSVSDTIRFAAGETVAVITVPILDDAAAEPAESVLLTLTSPQGLQLARGSAVATIIDNDTPAAAPLVLVGDAIVNEADGAAQFAITLDRASSSTITVSYQTTDGSAVVGKDYVGQTSSVVFLPGETAKMVSIQVLDDAIAEGNELFGLQLTAVTGGAVLADAEGRAVIEQNDGQAAALPSLSVDDVVVSEGGRSLATFVFRLSQPSTSAVSVAVALSGATTSSSSDYMFLLDTIRFGPGETVRTWSVPIVDDTTAEPAETFVLGLSSAQGLILERTNVVATIVDNDTPAAAPAVSVGDAFVNETDGEARFAITLDRAPTTAVVVSYQTSDGTALAGNDYAAEVSSVVFLPGETAKTVSIQLINDGAAEADEIFALRLTGATGGATLADSVGTAVIDGNDGALAPAPVLEVDDILVSEGGLSLATFVLRLSQPSAGTVSAAYTVSPGTASFLDYVVGTSGAVTFAPGETVRTISIPLINDATAEAAEKFTLDLQSAQGLTFARTSIPATIIDDDGPVLITGVDAIKAEGQTGFAALTFAVTLKQAFATSQTVNWATIAGGFRPAAASDFAGGVLPSGSLTFAPGETRKLLTVNVAGDGTLEGDEYFIVNVTDPSGTLGIGTVQAMGAIVDDDAFAVSVAATTASVLEANAGSTPFSFTISLNRASVSAQTVGWTVTGIGPSPADGADFAGGALPSGTVTFNPGETSKTIVVNAAGDLTVESSETFAVSVSSVTAGLVAGASIATATILNDDAATVSIAAQSAIKAEGHGGASTFTFTVTLDKATTSSETVSWAVSGSGANAAAAADFVGGLLPSGTVTFAAGQQSKTIEVSVQGDALVEADEAFVVTLANPSSALALGVAAAGGTILNDDAEVSVAVAGIVKAEGHAGPTPFGFVVTRSGDISVSHSVSYAVTGNGANMADGADFVGAALPGGTLVFAVGESSRTIVVEIAGDAAVEPDEGFLLTLGSPSAGLGVGTASVTATIMNDDASLSVTPLAATRAEGDAGATIFTFTLSRTGDMTQAHGVAYTVAGTGANPANAADFVGGLLPAGTVTFAIGETSKVVSIEVAGDTLVENDEGFVLSLGAPGAGAVIGTASAIGTILADDAVVSLAAGLAISAEGNAGSTTFTFIATRMGDVSAAASVSYGVTGSGAAPVDATDFFGGVLPSGIVTFGPGEAARTIIVNVAGNTAVEADEGFTMALTNPSPGLALGTAVAIGTIVNDDASISIAPLSAVKAEGHTGTTAFTFTLTQTGDVSLARSVAYAVSGSGAKPADAADFTGGVLATGTVAFAAGETTKMLTIEIQGDKAIEPDETFMVTLSPLAQVNKEETTSSFGAIAATGQTLGISLTAQDLSAAASENVHGLVSRFGGTGGGQYNIAFVVDRSGSTSSSFTGGQAVGDLNGDGQANTILDAEIAGFEALLSSINDLGLGNANIGVISFDSSAALNTRTAAGADANKNGVLDVVEALRGLTVGNSTNYEAGLQSAETFLNSSPAGQNVLFFLSDGYPDSDTAYADEVSRLLAGKTDIRAFGVGSGASQPALDLVDDGKANKTAQIFLDPSQLSSGLKGSGVTKAEVARVELLVDGQVVQTILPAQLTQTPLGLQYKATLTGLSATLAEQITARVVASDPATTTIATLQTLGVLAGPAELGQAMAEGTIVNDDAVISLVETSVTKTEGNGGTTSFVFTAARQGDLSVTHSVSYAVSGSGTKAVNADDFAGGALPAGTVTFAVGETAKTVVVEVAGDVVSEADEVFILALFGPSAGASVGSSSATGTILNDDSALSITALSAVKVEGHAGAAAFTFTVTLAGDTSIARAVSYGAAGTGNNPAGASDFTGSALPAGTLTFGVGETSKTLSINIAGDTAVEADETFSVTVSGPGGATASAGGTILNDDARVSIGALMAVKVEGNSGATPFTFTATRSGDISVAHSVGYAVTGTGASGAVAGDFVGGTLPSGTISFAAGEMTRTVTVNVAGDVVAEADETFQVSLANPSVGLVVDPGAATGTIQNDDIQPPTATVAPDDAYIVIEGRPLHIVPSIGVLFNDSGAAPMTAVRTSGPAHGTLTMTADGGFDYTPAAGFTGVDSFTYRASGGGGTDDGQVSIHVVPVQGGATTTLDLLALTPEEQIAATYAAFFGRGADAGGFQFWVNQFVGGLPTQGPSALFANIASSFGVSTEAKGLYPFLANPFGASGAQISAFLDSVYNNLFNRSSDAGGLAYWTGQIQQTLAGGQFVGSVLVSIMNGAQDTAAGKDITTLMGKVAVSMAYAHEQVRLVSPWSPTEDGADAKALLQAVSADPASVLIGVAHAHDLVIADLR